VTIGVECPHCETVFQFDRSMIGRSVRCPNRDCQEIFEVREPGSPPTANPAPPPEPAPASRNVADLLPLLEVELASAPVPPPLPKGKIVSPPPAAPRVVAWNDPTPVVPPAPQPSPIPKASPKPTPKPPRRKTAAEADDVPISTRKRRGGWNQFLLGFVLLGTLAAIGVGTWLIVKKTILDEQQMARNAEQLYGDGKYSEASKQYEELTREYPESSEKDKYLFFAKLASVHAIVGSVTARENPVPGQQAFAEFLKEFGDSPYSQPESGFGIDVVQAGKKLASTLADAAADRVKTFRVDRTKNSEDLTKATEIVEQGRALLQQIQKYRAKTDTAPPESLARLDAVNAEIAQEQARLALLRPWQNLADSPTDFRIERFEQAMKAASLQSDPEVRALTVAAKKKLRELVGFTPDPISAFQSVPESATFTMAVPPVAGGPVSKPAADPVPETVFAVARGVLYALDSQTGALLWGTRIGPTIADPRTTDLPLRLTLPDGESDWTFVCSARGPGGEPGITARRTRTGEVVWHQPLAQPPLGRPVVLGNQIYVPLADELGTILQFKLTTGDQVGRIEIRQPIGNPLALMARSRPGHGFLVVPADARRVFVFELGREEDDGRRFPPRVALVLATGHPKDSLRGEPILVGTDEPTSPRHLVLAQSDGPTSMKLRSFPLPKLGVLEKGDDSEEVVPGAISEATVPGWSWFAPISDGERIAVTTDSGTFAVFGINQPGNTDKPLFALNGPKPTGDGETVTRGQIISADEESYWLLLDGKLMRVRSAVDATTGPRLVPQGTPLPVGEPIQRAQIHANLNLGIISVLAGKSGIIHTLAFDLDSGAIRWHRQLGTPAAHELIPTKENEALLIDRAAGVYRLHWQDRKLGLDTINPPRSSPAAEAISVLASADAKSVWVLIPEANPQSRQLTVRRYRDSKLDGEATLPLPERLAGKPMLFGERLLLPVANGFVLRWGFGDARPQAGPIWRGTATATTTCHLSMNGPDEFFASDGATRALRWKWPADQPQAVRVGVPLVVRDAMAAPVLTCRIDDKSHWIILDQAGGVSLFDAIKPEEPIRKWKGSPMGDIPPGSIDYWQLASDGTRVVYSVNRQTVVCLDPAQEKPAWVRPAKPGGDSGQLCGLTASPAGLLLTYQSGLVQHWSLDAGRLMGQTQRQSGDSTASQGAILMPSKMVLLAGDDNTTTAQPLVPVR
jgi:hypothetical protein